MLRLLKELHKARQDEIFGGLSLSERDECDKKLNRISELEILSGTTSLSLFSEHDPNTSHAWDTVSETQTFARQLYRDREKDSRDSKAESNIPENSPPNRAITDDE